MQTQAPVTSEDAVNRGILRVGREGGAKERETSRVVYLFDFLFVAVGARVGGPWPPTLCELLQPLHRAPFNLFRILSVGFICQTLLGVPGDEEAAEIRGLENTAAAKQR